MIPLPIHVTSVALIANGAMDDPSIAHDIQKYGYRIAVDGGLSHCQAMGIGPDLIVGDLDSVTDELLAQYPNVPIHRLQRAKNETDLEVAIALVDQPQVTHLAIFCGLQLRTDHCLANLQLLRRYPGRLELLSSSERIFCVRGDVELPTTPAQVVSLMGLGGPVRGVSSQGFVWELVNRTFDATFFSLSNEAVGRHVRLSIPEGDLICILQRGV